ncbi:hypothetical protein BaRGS_00006971, partial [Batillaria attramentaria]
TGSDNPSDANIYDTLERNQRDQNEYTTFSNPVFAATSASESDTYENVQPASAPRRKIYFTILN